MSPPATNSQAVPVSVDITDPIFIDPLPHSLDHECPVPWPNNKDPVNQDYPFQNVDGESPKRFVTRRYLETLWLPESIMPRRNLVKSLRRLRLSSDCPQVVHETLEPVLLSVRTTIEKYSKQLPQVLQNKVELDNDEKRIIWYAFDREVIQSDKSSEGDDAGESEEVRKRAWLQRAEHREVQIQILLYLHLLSVPLPPQKRDPPVTSSKKQRRKKPHLPSPTNNVSPPAESGGSTTSSTPSSVLRSSPLDIHESFTLEDRVERFMDMISVWQLVERIPPPGTSRITPEESDAESPGDRMQELSEEEVEEPDVERPRDWMQEFCEEVVEPLFRDCLPKMCDLFRTKVYPHSPFSHDSDSDSSLSSPPRPAKRTKTTRKGSASARRLQEVGKPQTPRSRTNSTQSSTSGDSQDPDSSQSRRSRSRSLSESADEVRERGANRGGVASSKNLWKGEVDMKRTTSSRSDRSSKSRSPGTPKINAKKLARKRSRGALPSEVSRLRSPSSRDHKQLVTDSPVNKLIKVEYISDNPDITDSPDELLLTDKRHWHESSDDDDDNDRGTLIPVTSVLVADTPVKKK